MELLVEGAGAHVAPGAPARLVLRRDTARADTGLVSLALTPTRLSSGESFLVSVVAEALDGSRREVGSFGFFPPPREGVTRRFPLDLSRVPADIGALTLEVRLVPVGGRLEDTRLTVEGVRAGK